MINKILISLLFGAAIVAAVASTAHASDNFVHHTYIPGGRSIQVDRGPNVQQKYKEQITIFRALKASDSFFKTREVHLKITNDPSINAKSYNIGPGVSMVDINQGFLDWVKQYPDRINYTAEILGHELGHIKHGEASGNMDRIMYCHVTNAGSRQCEKQADLYGQGLATRAGYNGCTMSQLFIEFRKTIGNGTPDGDHPQCSVRAAYLKCGRH